MSDAILDIVRSVDLGWGYTKLSRCNKKTGELEYLSFPSLAPRHTGVDLSMSILGKRDTVVVNVDGTKYEVGPDSGDLDTNDASRNLNDAYMHTEQYKAVFLGALHYIGEPEIDLLVVGLPLNNMHNAHKLKQLMEGVHKVHDTLTVTVKEALVLPQPLGGLVHCFSKKESIPELEFIEEEMNLVIDPGFLTFDFLLSNGEKVVENRSSAYSGGVSKVLRSIAESISAKFNIKYENLSAIDAGLRRRYIKINGVKEPLEEHIRNTKPVLESAVNYMRNILGDGSDVDNIILLGGGGAVYRKTIEQYYPNHKVIAVEDGQLAIVRGYQAAGEKYLASRDN
ncbi:PRTRC system protein D [Nostoc sp. CHAB 5834]|nr:PRTRC system protein D [Nostoc sp. CHAB 5834]